MGVFVMSKSSDGWMFELQTDEGEAVLKSGRYMSRHGCLNGIEAAQICSQDKRQYRLKVGEDADRYFVLMSVNGRILGRSAVYLSAEACETGLKAVMEAARGASVYDNFV